MTHAAVSDKPFNPAILDGKGTGGITPPKSNWAQKLDTARYVGFSVTCGLFYHNYPGGAALMAGSVFGKAAGESAAADIGAKAT